MPRPDKVQAVEDIKASFDEASALFLTEYRGLTVAEQQALRRELRAAGTTYRVVKMSLARRAAAELGMAELSELLAGPTAVALAHDDPTRTAKVLRDFAKDHESLLIKGGALSGEVLTPERISYLADIEPREVLLAKMAGAAKAPLGNLAGLLASFTRDLASMIGQLVDRGDAGAAVEEPEAVPEPDAAAESEEGDGAPAAQTAGPAEQAADRAEQAADPAEQAADPAEQAAGPADETADPADEEENPEAAGDGASSKEE